MTSTKIETSVGAPPFRHWVGMTGTTCPNGCDELIIFRLGMLEWYMCLICRLRISNEELANIREERKLLTI